MNAFMLIIRIVRSTNMTDTEKVALLSQLAKEMSNNAPQRV